ncbi:large ribosomal subunit protein uL4c [Daucus carota subsp. sativus]|uniref:large ribosomal subunit protein uL4c n=1 Tax=Daucus carota subsp. sativus TaxID=79200 RepID=UPI0007EEFA3D|nr:PREDICTED: 50S ribosomal protein L4, chloroplastic [Daucus carota subsp. sativus]
MAVSITTTPLSSSTLSYFSSSSLFLSHKFTHSCSLSKKPTNPLSISHSIHSQLATLPILSFDGEKVGETTLSLKSAPPETARAVVHRGITTDLTNRRRGTASTLTRAEVRGGGKKPYPQKKTGRARQGSRRTPLRPGGGVVFGPKPKDWSIKINKKEKRLAISTALASALSNGIVIEEFGDRFEKPKTKEFIGLLNRLGIDPCEKSLFLMTDVPDNVRLSGRNIGTLKMLTPRTLNLFDILNSDKLVFTKDAVEYLNEAYGYDLDGDSEIDEDEDEDEDEGEDEATDGEVNTDETD